jgi:mRNA-degrading endonuclease RelE of RelBE toxin-antitoxin system
MDMRHRRTQSFKRAFESLPPEAKAQAVKAFRLFKDDPHHPSLHIERVQGYPGVWAGRVSDRIRWTFHFEADEDTGEPICVHRVIGDHDAVYRAP